MNIWVQYKEKKREKNSLNIEKTCDEPYIGKNLPDNLELFDE